MKRRFIYLGHSNTYYPGGSGNTCYNRYYYFRDEEYTVYLSDICYPTKHSLSRISSDRLKCRLHGAGGHVMCKRSKKSISKFLMTKELSK